MQNNKETANATPKYQTIFVAHALHTQQNKKHTNKYKEQKWNEILVFLHIISHGLHNALVELYS